MPEYRRPGLVTADPVEVSEFLLGAFGPGHSIRTVPGDAMFINITQTAAALDAALATYTPVAPIGKYRSPLPGTLATHVAHLQAYLAATPAQIAALTQAQKDHVLQDCVLALKLLIDDRLA
jgi:hypothetical protein